MSKINWVSLGTVVIAAATVVNLWVSIAQWHAAVKSADAALSSAKAALQSADVAKTASDTAKAQLIEMAHQTTLMVDQANAARSAAETAYKALVDGSRPLLDVDVSSNEIPVIGTGLIFPTVAVDISNIGNQTAIIRSVSIQPSYGFPILPDALMDGHRSTGVSVSPCDFKTDKIILRIAQKISLECKSAPPGFSPPLKDFVGFQVYVTCLIAYNDPLGFAREAAVSWSWKNDDHGNFGHFHQISDVNRTFDRFMRP